MTTTAPDFPGSALLQSVREYFTLENARAAQSRISAPQRGKIGASLALSRQRSDAADALWSAGHSAEALRLAASALDSAAIALENFAGVPSSVVGSPPMTEASDRETSAQSEEESASDDGAKAGQPSGIADAPEEASSKASTASEDSTSSAESGASSEAKSSTAPTALPGPAGKKSAAVYPELAKALRDRGLRDSDAQFVVRLIDDARRSPKPELDSEISPAHATLYAQLVRAHHLIERQLGTTAMDHSAIRWLSARRIAWASILSLVLLAGLYYGTRSPEFTYRASAVYGDMQEFQPERAFDGQDSTWWLAPDGPSGWVEVEFGSARRIEKVKILNTSNPPWNDRGTNQYRLEFYSSGGELVHTIDGTLERQLPPEWVEMPVAKDNVKRIRLQALSPHGTSVGVSELAWE